MLISPPPRPQSPPPPRPQSVKRASSLLIKNNKCTKKLPVVYIMASGRNGTLYPGVTGNLPARVRQHKNDVAHGDMATATLREIRLKRWRRKWKLALMRERAAVVEHPYANIKRNPGGRFSMRGLENVKAELSLSVPAYNLRRVINILAAPT